MFGWLATRSSSPCLRLPREVVSRRSCQMAPGALLRALPGLGCVLYVHAASASVVREASPCGLLVAERAFAPLLETRGLVATSLVTDDGPREWLECVDSLGRVRARLHLLPDTDYLAWDALLGSREAERHALPAFDTSLLRPDHAVVVNFQLRKVANLLVLERGRSQPLSSLGDCIAARIARAESAWLPKDR
jgi:hypothetical protein